jgi:membrane-bound lytic murein transglycosylase D
MSLAGAAAIALFAGNVCGASAQDPGPTNEWLRLGLEWIEANVPEDILTLLSQPTEDEWQEFWEGMERVLQSESLDDLAWLRPQAELALAYLAATPDGQPYADWLRPRLDYLRAADEVTHRIPGEPPTAAPPRLEAPAAERAAKSIVPSKRPAPAKTAPAVAARRSAAVRNFGYWKNAVRKRPAADPGAALIPKLKTVFAEEGVPDEWVWIAEVESSLDPAARSPAGACGLFQFMPGTARRFGLRTARPDERLEPEKSARAAARYLKSLHRQFGNWELALAAYNAGEGTVDRALQRHGTRSFDAVAAHLPAQTQMYVPKVMATVAVREQIDPRKLPPPRGPG